MIRASIPIALQIVIDDVGWWCGTDDNKTGGPFRTGFCREHVPADYQAIIDLGRRLHMRPQAAMILADWDRTNLLRRLPSATWMGAGWDNSFKSDPRLDETSALLAENSRHIELALHGVGHEFWSDGVPTRAEWHDQTGQMRPRDQVEAHLDAFMEIWNQNSLGSDPFSFVPTAFLHRFGDPEGLAPILARRGIRYTSSPYGRMFFHQPSDAGDFGIDGGLLMLDRGTDPLRWFTAEPDAIEGEITGAICGMHWPNLLARDPARNSEVIDRWVRFLAPYDTRFDRMLGPDTSASFSQLVYHRWTRLKTDPDGLEFDFSRLEAATGLLPSFYLKITADQPIDPDGLKLTGLSLLEHHRELPNQWRLHLQRLPGTRVGSIRLTTESITANTCHSSI